MRGRLRRARILVAAARASRSGGDQDAFFPQGGTHQHDGWSGDLRTRPGPPLPSRVERSAGAAGLFEPQLNSFQLPASDRLDSCFGDAIDEAKETLQTALRLASRCEEAACSQARATVRRNLGALLLQQNALSEAKRHFRESLRLSEGKDAATSLGMPGV